MTATAWELAVTTTVEDSTPETLARQLQARATQRLPITYQEAVKALLHVTATAWGLAATTVVEQEVKMPKIAEIEGTPNPDAVKFTLKEPLTWG